MTHDFTREALSTVVFPTDGHYVRFRDEVKSLYDSQTVLVTRHMVKRDGTTSAQVRHARGLGAELKGLAWGHFEGVTVSTVYPCERSGCSG